MFRYYLAPFKLKPVYLEIDDANETHQSKISSLATEEKIRFDQLPDKEELYNLLKLLTQTDQCFGKFDLYNKWFLFRVADKEISKRLTHLMKKPVTHCMRCKAVQHCMMHHTPLDELDTLWKQILINKGEQFRKVLPDKEDK